LSEAEIADRFDAIAAFAEVGDFMDQPVRLYSSGMYARLAFAVCAHVDADVLIVDEILAVGDAAFRQKCMRFLNRFRMHGSLLFVSHDSGAVVKLCDRAIWLEQGIEQASGNAKEVCRLYLAAQAEEHAADSNGRFRLGGRSVERAKEVVAGATRMASPETEHPRVAMESFVFDPDDSFEEQDSGGIEGAAFYDARGEKLGVAAGGEEVELRVVCRAGRAVAKPIVAFALRDRLNQVIFSDDTFATYRDAAPIVDDGRSWSARFFFVLPYLANGAYAIEAFLFDGDAGRFRLLHRVRDREFLWIQSSRGSNGLANLAMREVSLKVDEPGSGDNRRVAPSDAVPAVEIAAGK
jgi:lipopolysaccharide transport system ATP-binding protein